MAGFGWVLATLIAAAAQTARNATQASLTRAIGTIGATHVRFLFGLPFALVFLALVAGLHGEPIPALTLSAFGFTVLGALSQIAATALMLRLMTSQSFAVTTAWLKTEPVLVALIAAAVLGDPLTLPMLLAIATATAGVVLMSLKPGTTAAMWRNGGPALTGLLAGALFGLSAIGFRGAIVSLPAGDFLIRATTILALGLTLQAAALGAWLLAFDRGALVGSIRAWRPSLAAGFLGAFASQFWFIGFSLTSAANVRTLALIEVIFAQAVSRLVFRQSVSTRQLLGMAIIVLGVGMLLRSQP
ncbi:MAG: DMT family transporter [Tabrizicola sp.]|jgi:drug/metabolite transporter (DMT)-like permease|nr:DMT family transporter [Tabrizicola sp.]